jgi:L-alanine-DL-glutamate epimerase-like enolase superfamily enzyme
MRSTIITALEMSPLDLPLTEPFAIATGSQDMAANVLVTVRLADGTLGLGEAAPFPAVSGETQAGTLAALERLRPLVVGGDARAWRPLGARLAAAEGEAAAARCAVEMAVLDALAQHYRMPLHIFFGGAGTVLETDMTITAGDAVHAAQSAQAISARGIKTIKVKTAGVDVAADVDRVLAIHAAVPAAPLIVDGNCGYSAERALQFVRQLRAEGIALALFEQPLLREDWSGMAQLVRESGVPLAADESARSAADVLRLVQQNAANVINIKLMKAGVAEALRMISIAQAAGLGLMIGGMVESILAMSFSAHLAAGSGGFGFVDLDTPLFIAQHPFSGGFAQAGGTLTLDDTPGHGVKINPAS